MLYKQHQFIFSIKQTERWLHYQRTTGRIWLIRELIWRHFLPNLDLTRFPMSPKKDVTLSEFSYITSSSRFLKQRIYHKVGPPLHNLIRKIWRFLHLLRVQTYRHYMHCRKYFLFHYCTSSHRYLFAQKQLHTAESSRRLYIWYPRMSWWFF